MTVKSLTNQEALQTHSNILNLHHDMKCKAWLLGQELYNFETKKYYLDLGYQTFNQYLACPDVSISRSTAFMFKAIYQKYMVELESPAAGLLEKSPEKLYMLAPHITEDNQDEWMAKVDTLSRSDLRIEIREEFGKQNGHDPFPDKIKMAKSIIFDASGICNNALVRGLLEQVYTLLDKVLENYSKEKN